MQTKKTYMAALVSVNKERSRRSQRSATELKLAFSKSTQICNNWLRHFGVSDQLVQELGGLQKLRICFRHFNQRKEMAKTRIKNTPLRTAKVEAAAATTTTTTATPTTAAGSKQQPIVDSTTIELVESPSTRSKLQQPLLPLQSVTTITAVPPQRSHSICSSGSSDVLSISSDYEASMPLSSLDNASPQPAVPKNAGKKRKLYLITEKQEGERAGSEGSGQKRKMLVVVEEEKKLMIVTDKPQPNLAEHLEKFLPEILNRIQDKQAKQQQQQQQQQQHQPPQQQQQQPMPTIKEKPHITLPPKKNPTNFVKAKPTPTAMASISPVPAINNNLSSPQAHTPSSQSAEDAADIGILETNINLSPDFRFLMKILPKLEQLPEPQKQCVKRSIQIFVDKSYSIYAKKK
ncbi:putative uncharacterized protein DDB_G0282129 isoform X2 [Scaptodrosophila lebanonensis]|uniref:Uncharacterized protein n=1 Tax=Drosophila lebanonensis TaxID=7225 RepID=A0A6J2UER3_DROLE|nr:putative uncharacterized protein DDB_G0282129 isoform X2 [Scaptodrosophila lebanonensis]